MNLIKHPLTCLLGMTLALTACGTSAPVPQGVVTTQAVSALKEPILDGQAIFRGIAFGEQQLGELLPEVWQGVSVHDLASDEQDLKELVSQVDGFVEEVGRFDPTYFADLSASMRSGDPVQVENMLQRTGKTLESMFPEEVQDGSTPVADGANGRFIYRNRFLFRDRVVVRASVIGVDRVLIRNTAVVRDRVAIRATIVAQNSIVVRERILARLRIFSFRAEELDSLFNAVDAGSLKTETVIANLTERMAR